MGDGFTEQIDPHAFDDQLGGDVRALIDHDTRLVLGRTCAGTLTLRVDEHGLWGSIAVNEGDQDALNLYARVQRGDVSQAQGAANGACLRHGDGCRCGNAAGNGIQGRPAV